MFLARATGPAGFEKTLVVKRILPQLAARESFVEMFLAEARIAAQLSHQNIVQIFDFGEEDGTWFISMEFIDGVNLRSLSRWLKEVGPSSPAMAARIVMEACEGLAYAHEFVDPTTGAPMGLVHRDVSPENLMLTRTGGVKVLDFGIARVQGEDHGTRSGLLKGKIAYMPVEQLRGEELDRRADVYALGVVLYQLLSGHRPWEKGSEVALITSILNDPPTPLTAWVPQVPPALVTIVERATARERDLRFADCRALRLALERFIASTGRPPSTSDLATMAGRALEAELARQAATGFDSRSGSASRSESVSQARSGASLDADFSNDEHTEPGVEDGPVAAPPAEDFDTSDEPPTLVNGPPSATPRATPTVQARVGAPAEPPFVRRATGLLGASPSTSSGRAARSSNEPTGPSTEPLSSSPSRVAAPSQSLHLLPTQPGFVPSGPVLPTLSAAELLPEDPVVPPAAAPVSASPSVEPSRPPRSLAPSAFGPTGAGARPPTGPLGKPGPRPSAPTLAPPVFSPTEAGAKPTAPPGAPAPRPQSSAPFSLAADPVLPARESLPPRQSAPVPVPSLSARAPSSTTLTTARPSPEGLGDASSLGHTRKVVAPMAVLAALRDQATGDRSQQVLRRFPAIAARLMELSPDLRPRLTQTVAALVDAALVSDEHGLLVKFLEYFDLKGGPFAQALRAELGHPLRVLWLVERLRVGLPPSGSGLVTWLGALGPPIVPLLLWALEQCDAGPGQDTLARALGLALGGSLGPVVERLEAPGATTVAALCCALEASGAVERKAVFQRLLGRRDVALTRQVMTGRVRAGGAEVSGLLEAALGDRDEAVRVHAVSLISSLDDRRLLASMLTQVLQPAFDKRTDDERSAWWVALLSAANATAALAAASEQLEQKTALLTRKRSVAVKLAVVAGLRASGAEGARALLERTAANKTQPDEVSAAARAALAPPPHRPASDRLSIEQRAQLRRALVLELAMLTRAMTVVDVAGGQLDPAMERLRATLRSLVLQDGKLEVTVKPDGVAVNGALVPLRLKLDDERNDDWAPAVAKLLHARDLQGFAIDGPLPVAELRAFLIQWFDPEGASSRAPHVRVATFSGRAVPAAPLPVANPAPPSLEAWKGAFGFLLAQRDELREGRLPTLGSLDGFLEQWSRLYLGGGGQVLAVTPAPGRDDEFAVHAVNTACLAMAFAGDLELGGATVREVAELALCGALAEQGRAARASTRAWRRAARRPGAAHVAALPGAGAPPPRGLVFGRRARPVWARGLEPAAGRGLDHRRARRSVGLGGPAWRGGPPEGARPAQWPLAQTLRARAARPLPALGEGAVGRHAVRPGRHEVFWAAAC